MAEYIEREKTVELLRSLGNREYRKEKGTIQDAIKMISYPEYTPAADVAPVVRCKGCKHLVAVNVNGKGIPTCRVSGMEVAPDEFCSRGEKGRRCGL